MRQKESTVKTKISVSRQPDAREKYPLRAALEKALRQAKQGAAGNTVESDERRAEDQAGETVQKTAFWVGDTTQKVGDAARSFVRRVAQSRQEQRVETVPVHPAEPVAPPHAPKATPGTVASESGQTAPSPESRGRELAQSRTKQRTECLKERAVKPQTAQTEHGAGVAAQESHPSKRRPGKPGKSRRKSPEPRLRHTSASAAKGAQTASVPTRRARLRAMRSSAYPRSAARGIKGAAQKLAAGFKAVTSAVKSLPAALVAGGAVAVTAILLVCLIAMVAGSSFGIFFAAQPTGSGESLQTVVRQLSGEYYAQIEAIKQSIPHDRLVVLPDGPTAIRWQDVLSVFAADMAAAENGQPVAVLEQAQIDRLKEILWLMNPVSHRTCTEEHEEEQTSTDEDGNEMIETVTVTETVLEITIRQETPQDTAAALGFTARQNEQLALLSDPQYMTLWMELLGGYVSGGGQIITPEHVPVGTGAFQWPLPEAFTITSGFGERVDPFTGESDFHTGTDIAAPAGTPILAAADGTVTIANATDPWGGSYGYYIKLDHGNGLETLYAHCSAICVTPGQTVRQGEVIGYVGSTGNSTGNHLHFEVRINAQRVDAMTYFTN